MSDAWDITKHYGGTATVVFKPGAHGYWVTDPEHPDGPVIDKRTGGGTSLTGTLNKGAALMMWPMWEMNKSLKQQFETMTVLDLISNPDITLESILLRAREAHKNKSDLGKSVGTSAHAWVEEYSKAKMASQQTGEPFVEPPILEVEDIVKVLRAAYIRVINTTKPGSIQEFEKLPKLFTKEIEINSALHAEATMVRQSTIAAKAWLDMHDIIVHGTEDTVYSRKMFVCGKYDGDWTVPCTKKCGWCYRNGNMSLPEKDYTGRYIVDFKSTNASAESPKGIYPEYLVQCAIYDVAKTEEFPEIHFDGYLILNGSKKPLVDKKTGYEYPVFNTHFSFDTTGHRRWAILLAENKELIWRANQEMKESNEAIKPPKKAAKSA